MEPTEEEHRFDFRRLYLNVGGLGLYTIVSSTPVLGERTSGFGGHCP